MNDATPPKWAQYLERKMDARLKREKNGLLGEGFTSRLMYYSVVVLSYSMLAIIFTESLMVFSKTSAFISLYVLICFSIAAAIWGGLNYYQFKRRKKVWDLLPIGFRLHAMKQGPVYRFNWHIISLAILSGFIMFFSRSIGLQTLFVPLNPTPITAKPAPIKLTPEQQKAKKALEHFAEVLGTKPPSDLIESPPNHSVPASHSIPTTPATPHH
jgi:hypothetical protein